MTGNETETPHIETTTLDKGEQISGASVLTYGNCTYRSMQHGGLCSLCLVSSLLILSTHEIFGPFSPLLPPTSPANFTAFVHLSVCQIHTWEHVA